MTIVAIITHGASRSRIAILIEADGKTKMTRLNKEIVRMERERRKQGWQTAIGQIHNVEFLDVIE